MRTVPKNLVVPNSEDSTLAAEALKSLDSDCPPSAQFKLQFRTNRGGSQSISLPSFSVKLLIEALRQTVAGNAVRLVPIRKELTTQEAAEILNVSRPFLIGLVEKGAIPARMVGSHRRIPLLPLLEYRRKTAAIQEEALAQMAAEAQELKLYQRCVATIAAVLDACVLYPARLRDLLLSLAAADLFRPVWSETIQEEWIRNVLANRPDLDRGQLERTCDLMNRAFPGASIQGEAVIPTLTLPDPDDRHVLASAIHAHAELIITINVNDFPPTALLAHGIVASHPDPFVDNLFTLDEEEALASVAKMRRRLRAPSMTPKEFIESFEQVGMLLTAARLRQDTSRI